MSVSRDPEVLQKRLAQVERDLRLAREELVAGRDSLLEEIGWSEPWGPVAVIGQLRHLLRRCSTHPLDEELAVLVEAALDSSGPYGAGLELSAEHVLGSLQLGSERTELAADEPESSL